MSAQDPYLTQRHHMIASQIAARGIRDERVLAAMRKVKRELFVPPSECPFAYEDRPLPIGYNQTISQPYIVAYMTEAAGLLPADRVLEVGTGCGYQAAVLAEIVKEVYSLEVIGPLAGEAAKRLGEMGYANIFVREGDGYDGWAQKAPFDAIVVTAAAATLPEALIGQLKEGGRLIAPIGEVSQELYRFTKTGEGFTTEFLLPVRFVPMVHGEGK